MCMQFCDVELKVNGNVSHCSMHSAHVSSIILEMVDNVLRALSLLLLLRSFFVGVSIEYRLVFARARLILS